MSLLYMKFTNKEAVLSSDQEDFDQFGNVIWKFSKVYQMNDQLAFACAGHPTYIKHFIVPLMSYIEEEYKDDVDEFTVEDIVTLIKLMHKAMLIEEKEFIEFFQATFYVIGKSDKGTVALKGVYIDKKKCTVKNLKVKDEVQLIANAPLDVSIYKACQIAEMMEWEASVPLMNQPYVKIVKEAQKQAILRVRKESKYIGSTIDQVVLKFK